MCVVARGLVKYDVLHVRLNLLHPFHVLFRKLDGLFWVILKFDRSFVGFEVFATSEGIGNASLTLLFPATCVTINRRPVRIRFADDFDPLGTTAAVNAKLRIARLGRALFVRVARQHALVATLRLDL